jgi:hypothetical protein
MIPRAWKAFWRWYESHYLLNVAFAAGLFVLQIIHLIWLLGDVVMPRLGVGALFDVGGVFEWLLIIVDYTEVPALVTVSLLYINELRRGFSWRAISYLAALNVQWLHLFWITDEFVLVAFSGGATVFPVWLAWIAIFIDYLELPVMAATIRRLITALRGGPSALVAVFAETTESE